MGDLTRSDYVTRVLKTLGNMPTSQPVIAAGMHLTAINNAPNRLIRENPDLFPEHHGRTWTVGPTEVPDDLADPVVSGNRIPTPRSLLVLEKVRCNNSSVDPGTWASVQEFVVTMPPNAVETIGLLAKDTNTTGYPTMIARKDSDLEYWPTTRAGFECYFRLYGISREIPLTADDSTFLMDRDFDQAIVLVAASEVAEIFGWTERAQELLTMAGSRLGKSGVVGKERALKPFRVTIAGMMGGRR